MIQEAPSAQGRARQYRWVDLAVTSSVSLDLTVPLLYVTVGHGAVWVLPRWGDLRWEKGHRRHRDHLKQARLLFGSRLSAPTGADTEHTCCCGHVGISGLGYLKNYPGSCCPKNRQNCFLEESYLPAQMSSATKSL